MSEREEKLDRDDEEDGAIKPILVSMSKVLPKLQHWFHVICQENSKFLRKRFVK